MIIPPVAEKHAFFQHEVIRRTWGDAASALRSATRVFCLGYSLPESDLTMRFLLHSCCPENRTKLYLVNNSSEVVARYQTLLPKTLLPKDCYDLDVQYVGSDPIPRLVDALMEGRLESVQQSREADG